MESSNTLIPPHPAENYLHFTLIKTKKLEFFPLFSSHEQLYAYIHFLAVVYNLTGFNVICARAIGPLPTWLCAFQVSG